MKLLEAINRGQFLLNGFRNRDLREVLFADAPPATPEETNAIGQGHPANRSARPRCDFEGIETHRYQVTVLGSNKVTALLAARQADTEQLLKAA